MSNKLSVTVGIPALNEEKNICSLIKAVMNQKAKSYVLEKVVVISDASTDATVKITKQCANSKLFLIKGRERMGKSRRVNQIFKISTSDVCVQLDADILITDDLLLEKLVSHIINQKADLVSGEIKEIEPNGFIGKTVMSGMDYKRSVFNDYKKGSNFFTCHGPVRAFSRKFYETIKFNFNPTEDFDLYCYLYCQKFGFKYFFAREAAVYYRTPESLSDYRKQSLRFLGTFTYTGHKLDPSFVSREKRLPSRLFLAKGVKSLLKDRFYFVSYVLLVLLNALHSRITGGYKLMNAWPIVNSTKDLR